jgi:sulfide dehydrogenase cytochrome subunit
MRPTGLRRLAALTVVAGLVSHAAGLGTAGAATAGLAPPPGASSCSGCHGAQAGAVPAIHGRPADQIVQALDAFRTGKRPATVMNRIAPGFSEGESRAIATWLSAQKAPQ